MKRAMYFAALLLLGLTLAGGAAAFEDDEACLMCHKYPKMGRIDENGVQKVYYVIPEVFSQTVHRNVPCRDCHNYIQQLPHEPVKEGVSCTQDCHLVKNPATGKPFNHKAIDVAYQKSVHARGKIAAGLDADKPYCITCHTNPLYNPAEKNLPAPIVNRCVVCHEDQNFAEKWYRHTARRIREVKRSSAEIAVMCGGCHADEKVIKRHMDAAQKAGKELGKKFPVAYDSYLDSFHGKVSKYGNAEAANCVDCHSSQTNYFLSVHEIRASRDPASPLHESNRAETCKRCHKAADANFAKHDPHPTGEKHINPFTYYAEIIYGAIGNVALFGLIGLAGFETLGRRRDGATWRFKGGSSWWGKSRRGRKRIA